VRLQNDGGYTVDQKPLEEMFGPARRRNGAMEQKHFDLAHSLQAVLEETVLELSRWLQGKTGMKDLCMAGGVALNCVLNARLRDQGPFERIWVQPAAGDAGTALGAALLIDSLERTGAAPRYRMGTACLGPSYNDGEIEEFLSWSKLPYRKLEDIARETAVLLTEDKVIGWFQGRMEFGPRALGARSILASPLHASMQMKLNEIKDREDFRPVAPAVLFEEAGKWFANAVESPFMLFVNNVLPDKAAAIPAVTHVDGTARIQTVRREQNELYYDLIKAFADRTGVPVLVNTSFNTRGKPIVCSPRDAVECFWSSPLDALVIGSFLLEKRS
jgi:carbamoyltransferase